MLVSFFNFSLSPKIIKKRNRKLIRIVFKNIYECKYSPKSIAHGVLLAVIL